MVINGGEREQAVGEHGQQHMQLQDPARVVAHEADARVDQIQQHRDGCQRQDHEPEVFDGLAQAGDQQRRHHRPGGERQRIEEGQIQPGVAEDGLVQQPGVQQQPEEAEPQCGLPQHLYRAQVAVEQAPADEARAGNVGGDADEGDGGTAHGCGSSHNWVPVGTRPRWRACVSGLFFAAALI
jgi:hypothetical protein